MRHVVVAIDDFDAGFGDNFYLSYDQSHGILSNMCQ